MENKMVLDVPEIPFSVEYVRAALYSKVILENIPQHGSVKIQSNLLFIEGKANHEPVIYLDNERIDLSKNGHFIEYDEGFCIEDDFSIQIIAKDIKRNTTFFYISDKSGYNEITLQKWYGNMYGYNREMEYFILNVSNGALIYRVTSEIIDVLQPYEQVSIIIRREKNLYSLTTNRVLGGVT